MSMNVQTCPNCRILVELTEIGRCPRCRELVELKVPNTSNNPYQSPECMLEPLTSRKTTLPSSRLGLDCAIISILAAACVPLLSGAARGLELHESVAGVIAYILLISGAISGVIGLVAGIRNRSCLVVAIACVGCIFHIGLILLVLLGVARDR